MSPATNMTKCLFFNCPNEAHANYPCCSQDHGKAVKMEKEMLDSLFDADYSRPLEMRGLYSLERVEYVSKL